MKAPGSPAWRKAGRPAKMPVKTAPAPAPDDLHGKDVDELLAIGQKQALITLIQQTRKPTRHATAVTSSARELLAYSMSKPAQKIEQSTEVSGGVEVTIHDHRTGE